MIDAEQPVPPEGRRANDAAWASKPASRFDVAVYRLGRRDFLLRPTGAAMGAVFRQVEDSIRAAVRASGAVDRIVQQLCEGVRVVASRNPLVGDELLVTVLPRPSVEQSARGVELTGRISPGSPSFLFSPGSSGDELIIRQPNHVLRSGSFAHPQLHPGKALTEAQIRERYLRQKQQFERHKFR